MCVFPTPAVHWCLRKGPGTVYPAVIHCFLPTNLASSPYGIIHEGVDIVRADARYSYVLLSVQSFHPHPHHMTAPPKPPKPPVGFVPFSLSPASEVFCLPKKGSGFCGWELEKFK